MRRPALRRALRGFGAGGAALGVALVLATSGCGGGELESHLSKGRSLFAHKHYEEAQLEGLYVLLREPENEEALSLVARSLLAQDRDGEAESYFHTLAEKSPLHAMEAGQRLRVLATDPGSVRDFQVFARHSGHLLLASEEADGVFIHVLQKS